MKKILIVEDEMPLANALKMKLSNEGFEVEVSSNGEEGLNKVKESPYDLIILDLVMPKVDGFQFLEEIRNLNMSVPVIVASNLSQVEDKQKVKELGAVDYFVKSNVSLSSIVEQINNFFEVK